jgi:UDP-2,3-diacylglucosamine hydrolase
MPKSDYIVSDTHLGAVPAATERDFVRFLEHAGANAAKLVINGDLFDFWFEWGPVVPAQHYRVLAALSHVVDAGVPVTLIGGNHDAWGGRFLSDEVGLQLHDGILRTTIGGRNALVAHGDGLGKGDLKYRALKSVLRSRAAIWGFRALHPELGMKLARRVSSTHGKAGHDTSSASRAAFLEHWARERFTEDAALRLIFCGHSHLPVVIEMDAGRYYVNSGDWINHRSYVIVAADGAPQLQSWTDQAGSL